jgi:predicted acyltransferase
MTSDKQPTSSPRLMSLDALRGFDMFWIIGGSGIFSGLALGTGNETLNNLLPQLHHVPWEGFRFIDLIMPLFLFVVGAAMPFSISKRLARGDSKVKLYIHIINRVIILFVLGMVAQGRLLAYDLSKLHIFCNTLQAIAAGYLIASLLMLNLNIKGQLVATVGLLLLFWGLMTWVPVPGHGAGVLTAEGNLAIWLDHEILGRFQDGTSYTWILSSITFGCTTMLGVFAGELLRSEKKPVVKVLLLLGAGIACLLVGWLWGRWFPIIKHLWTSSFVLYSGGICYLLLAVFYLIIDVWNFRRWAFGFAVIGINAIAVYMATSLFDFRRIGDIFVAGLSKWTGSWQDFIRAAAGFAIVWLILWWMYRKESFIKI